MNHVKTHGHFYREGFRKTGKQAGQKKCLQCDLERQKLRYANPVVAVRAKLLMAQRKEQLGRDEVNRIKRERRKGNPDVYRESEKQWRLANPERHRATSKRSNEKHVDTVRAGKQRYRARRLGVFSDLTSDQWFDRIVETGSRCVYCLRRLKLKEITQDHVIPLLLNGPHTLANVVPACRPCNSRKRDRVWTPAINLDPIVTTQ